MGKGGTKFESEAIGVRAGRKRLGLSTKEMKKELEVRTLHSLKSEGLCEKALLEMTQTQVLRRGCWEHSSAYRCSGGQGDTLGYRTQESTCYHCCQ